MFNGLTKDIIGLVDNWFFVHFDIVKIAVFFLGKAVFFFLEVLFYIFL